MSKTLVKRVLSDILSFCGVHSFLERVCFSGKAFILMYHRVLASVEKQPYFVQSGMFVSVVSFEKHIAYLTSRYDVLFLEDLIAKKRQGEDISRCCAITFDDGWRDNYTEAFPLLKQYRVPATIFLTTGFVGTNRILWPEELCYFLRIIQENDTLLKYAPALVKSFFKKVGTYAKSEQEVYFDKAINTLKGYPSSIRVEILNFIRKNFDPEDFTRQMLHWDEVKEMQESGLVRFGAHSVNHEILDQVALETARSEIYQSRKEIERRIGSRINLFAYPNGTYNNDILLAVAESGCNAAVTTQKGFLNHSTPVMEIPRIAIHEDVSRTVPLFRSRILLKKF